MASFVGTFDEFIRYINPRAKNVVNGIAKDYKKRIGQCEHCGDKNSVLEAAHIAGRDRPIIIQEILEDFLSDGVVTVDLGVFERRLIHAHDPIDSVIKVLCRPCHNKYDFTSRRNGTTSVVEFEELLQLDGSIAHEINNAYVADWFRENVPRLSSDIVSGLLDADYCRNHFSVYLPVLKEVPADADGDTVRLCAKHNGYNRWSTQRPIQVVDKTYLVLTQWYPNSRKHFLEWKSRIMTS